MNIKESGNSPLKRIAITASILLAISAFIVLVGVLIELAPKLVIGLFFGACVFILVHSWIWDEPHEEDWYD